MKTLFNYAVSLASLLIAVAFGSEVFNEHSLPTFRAMSAAVFFVGITPAIVNAARATIAYDEEKDS